MTEQEEFEFRHRYEQEQASPNVGMGDVALGAIGRGGMNLLNTPMALADTALHGLTPPFLREQVPHLQNYPMKAAEAIGLVDERKQPQTAAQRIVDAAIQTGTQVGLIGGPAGAAVGLLSGAVGQIVQEVGEYFKIPGSTSLAIAAGMAVPWAVGGIRQPTLSPTMNARKIDTLKEGQAAGYVIQPSVVRKSAANTALESVSGKGAIAQEQSIRNQAVTDNLAAKSIGLPEGTPLSPDVLDEVREVASAPYREIAAMSPKAASALEGLKEARFRMSEWYKYYFRSGDPTAGEKARAFEAQAKNYEKVIDKEANTVIPQYRAKAQPPSTSKEVGFPLPATGKEVDIEMEFAGSRRAGPLDIMDRLKEGRKIIARTYDIERSMNPGDYHVSAPKIGALLRQGKPLDDELLVIGRFANAFPNAIRESANVPSPSPSKLKAFESLALGAGGYGVGGPMGAAIGVGVPMLDTPARNLALSSWYQKRLIPEVTPFSTSKVRSAIVGKSLLDYRDTLED